MSLHSGWSYVFVMLVHYQYNIIYPFYFQYLPKGNFSLQYQPIIKSISEENKENHQLGDIFLMYLKILRTDIKRTVQLSVGRITILNLARLIISLFSLLQ